MHRYSLRIAGRITSVFVDAVARRRAFSHALRERGYKKSTEVIFPSCLIHTILLMLLGISQLSGDVQASEAIPNRIVVLTFDDSVKSHFTVVRPLLKEYGFGATFFVTEGFDFATNKQDYMTWDEIAQLHQDGFEIGNHTRDHLAVTTENLPQLATQLAAINKRCEEHGIPRPTSFAFPGNAFDLQALEILAEQGIRFARRGTEPEYPYEAGSGIAYEPGLDHPLLIPTAGDARPTWTLADFQRAVERGQGGRVAVLQFHGVPDRAHPWVHTPPELFRQYMKYLADQQYQVIALRDLAKYVPPGSEPMDPLMAIRDRQERIKAGQSFYEQRTPQSEDELRYWLTNMVVDHHFSVPEVMAATGMSEADVVQAIQRLGLSSEQVEPAANSALKLLPYPGGRHPRVGFLDGEIRPQRETKFSVFTPWNPRDYVVLDIPEAVWMDTAQGPQLLYLAHTHVATVWDKQQVFLEPLEWQRDQPDRLSIQRTFPNGIAMSVDVRVEGAAVRMHMTLFNGTDQPLTGLRVQNCVMLKNAEGFAEQSNDNKLFRAPYAACRTADGSRWVITAWQPCQRPWGNERCPCLHSDPQFPDCAPGETVGITGWLSFYEGQEIDAELTRIAATQWARSNP